MLKPSPSKNSASTSKKNLPQEKSLSDPFIMYLSIPHSFFLILIYKINQIKTAYKSFLALFHNWYIFRLFEPFHQRILVLNLFLILFFIFFSNFNNLFIYFFFLWFQLNLFNDFWIRWILFDDFRFLLILFNSFAINLSLFDYLFSLFSLLIFLFFYFFLYETMHKCSSFIFFNQSCKYRRWKTDILRKTLTIEKLMSQIISIG